MRVDGHSRTKREALGARLRGGMIMAMGCLAMVAPFFAGGMTFC